MKRLLPICLMFVLASVHAAPPAAPDPVSSAGASGSVLTRLVTLDGRAYEEIRSLKVTPAFVSFLHRDGSARVRFDQMTEVDRSAFGYDPRKAAAYDAKLRAVDKRAAAAAAASQAVIDSKSVAYQKLLTGSYKDDRFLDEEPYWRSTREMSAVAALVRAGYSPGDASAALARLKANAASHHRKLPAGFLRVEGQLRTSPDGYQSKGIQRSHGLKSNLRK